MTTRVFVVESMSCEFLPIPMRVDAPDEHVMAKYRNAYMSENYDDPLRALVAACGDGHPSAVMSLISLVDDVNSKIRGDHICTS